MDFCFVLLRFSFFGVVVSNRRHFWTFSYYQVLAVSRKLELSCGLESKLTHFPHTVTMEPKYIKVDFKCFCVEHIVYT